MSLQTRLTALINALGADYSALSREVTYGRVVNPAGLHQWQAALGAASRYRAAIVAVGDSITEGTGAGAFFSTYPSRLQTILRAQKGIPGGPGYIAAARTATGLFLPQLPIVATGTSEYMNKYGLGGRASRTGTVATDNVTYDAQVCDRIRVWYSKAWLSSGLKIFIDDVDQGVTPNANAGSSAEEQGGLSWTSPVLTRGPHVVRITAANPDWPGYLEGVEFFDGDLGHGISVYNAGHFGYKTSDFLTAPMERHWDSVRALNPALGIIALGTNDLITAGMTGTVFANNLSAMIAKFPETSSILIVMPPQRGSNQTPADTTLWNSMKASARGLATGRVSFLDMQDWWPTLTSDVASGQGLMFDTVHPNTAGMDTYAEVIAEQINSPIRRR